MPEHPPTEKAPPSYPWHVRQRTPRNATWIPDPLLCPANPVGEETLDLPTAVLEPAHQATI
jgi:hypothetical protein